MRTICVVCSLLLTLMFTVFACQDHKSVNSADTDVASRDLLFAHPSFHEPLPDPGVFHNQVVVAYFAGRERAHHVPLTAEGFVSQMTSATNQVLAGRGRPMPARRDDIGTLYKFFVDLRDADIYNVFDVNESPARLVAYLSDIGALRKDAAGAIQFFVGHSAGTGYPDPDLLTDATLAISSDSSVRTFLAVHRASTELLSTLPLPDIARKQGGVVAMRKATAVGIVDAVAALSFAEFGPYATIIAGSIASTLYREALGDEDPLPMDQWPGPCIPCP